MAVFTLEDALGGVEVIAFPETYQRAASLIESGTMVLVRGKLERDDESVRILASEIAALGIAATGACRSRSNCQPRPIGCA
jgi:DNA polymerase III alpha subunit